ncbi:hypothetical protein AURDEDRAFT_71466 [Auricularia subglabra TFB-10046 SS5]|nr:hypothetical protein AURDEDRAFT_71466 [Auricularia subglabra TFB-10046 SS5]
MATQRACRCQATESSTPSRNLAVFIDGTSNQFSQKNTNVVELYSRLIKNENQLTFYNSGIGTYAAPHFWSWRYQKQKFKNAVDLAIAWNFENILLDAYVWLSENYQEGDRIYLFGFSRGAYQVRALSAMIHMVGLIHKGNQAQVPFAFQLYAETKPTENIDEMRSHFKRTFSRNVAVHFVGVWDTVSSVGLIRDKALPGTTDGMKHVCFFRHALALHERRVKFLPEYACGGQGPSEAETGSQAGRPPHTKEVWFAGSHSDMNLFGPALRWMSFEALLAGVQLSPAQPQWKLERQQIVHNSLSLGWWILECLPLTYLSYQDGPSTASNSVRRYLSCLDLTPAIQF